MITTQSKLYFNRTDNTIAVSKQPLKEESAQRTRTVQGVVVDDKGEPVIGASVQIKGEGQWYDYRYGRTIFVDECTGIGYIDNFLYWL